MKTRRMIIIVLLSILITLAVAVVCCQITYWHHKNWIIGKTSLQIQEQYGEFDQAGMPPASDGLHKNCGCSYYITKKLYGDYLYMFCITFDSDGRASQCRIERGPWGGQEKLWLCIYRKDWLDTLMALE